MKDSRIFTVREAYSPEQIRAMPPEFLVERMLKQLARCEAAASAEYDDVALDMALVLVDAEITIRGTKKEIE